MNLTLRWTAGPAVLIGLVAGHFDVTPAGRQASVAARETLDQRIAGLDRDVRRAEAIRAIKFHYANPVMGRERAVRLP